jgi:hypothetical protein
MLARYITHVALSFYISVDNIKRPPLLQADWFLQGVVYVCGCLVVATVRSMRFCSSLPKVLSVACLVFMRGSCRKCVW